MPDVMNLKGLLMMKRNNLKSWIVVSCLLLWGMVFVSTPAFGQVGSGHYPQSKKREDAELLAKALDYFMSKKYHECMLILSDLDSRYSLNPRYKAYLGVCYYNEWEYNKAVKCLDEAIPKLGNFAPEERSYYCWVDAESYFALQDYQRAQPLYESMLGLCQEAEKPDAYYRLGFCHLFEAEKIKKTSMEREKEEKRKAKGCFERSLEGYLKYRNTIEEKARISQIRHMIKGLE